MASDGSGGPGALRHAVLGAGEVGTGWAALAAAHGRRVALYDPDGAALERAVAAVRARVERLVQAGFAETGPAAAGLAELTPCSTLADAATDADLIVDASPEALNGKRQLLAAAESAAGASAAGASAILATTSSGLHASELSRGLARPERLIVAHPLVPVELIPVVEVVPGPDTAPDVVGSLRAELASLGRVPIVLRREIAGNAVGRIAGAVWRECIDLVLDGVLDPADADQLVSLGPCVGWAAGGPHLTYELAAGSAGLPGFLDHLLPTFEGWWRELSTRATLSEDERARLGAAVAAAYGNRREVLRAARDERLAALVRVLGERPTG